jgi:tRNA threonylcarbamoyladenosine biosynthesis protein TsaE
MTKSQLRWRSANTEQTLAWGQALGEALAGGDTVALSGPLGAGKTHLTKGIARGVGVPAEEPVVSPTFVLVREYAGRLRLYHVDAYRLGDIEELRAIGLEEMIDDPAGCTVIEWADRFPDLLPPTACRIDLSHVDASSRLLEATFAVAPTAETLAALDAACSRVE